MRALTSLEEGRELPLDEEAFGEISRITAKIDGLLGWKEKEELEGRLGEVSNLLF